MKGQIYRIDFPDGYFYIGSTIEPLVKRLAAHKRDRMSALNKRQSLGYTPLTRFDIYLTRCGWNNPTISTHTHCEVDNTTQLLDIEMSVMKVHFDDPKCLNDVCRGKPRCHTEQQRLCWLERQLNRSREPWREFWINKVLENWFLRSTIYGFAEAITEFEQVMGYIQN